MLIIGCDFHPSFQQVAIFENQTGEHEARRLWTYAQLCRAVVQASPSHPVVGRQSRTLE